MADHCQAIPEYQQRFIGDIERVQEKGTRNQFPFPSPREKNTNGNQKL